MAQPTAHAPQHLRENFWPAPHWPFPARPCYRPRRSQGRAATSKLRRAHAAGGA